MHIIRTFILRLLIDPDEPAALRGSLQPVPEGEAQPFADEAGLLNLLRGVTDSSVCGNRFVLKGAESDAPNG